MTPRGVRNNNPGNIRWGDEWQGLVPQHERTDPAFCQFTDAIYGIRALCKILLAYYHKHQLDTIQGIISRWAPREENNTDAYVSAVASMVGVDKDDPLTVSNYSIMLPLIKGIITHENGQQPYSADTLDQGLALAGVAK
jgi:hypothetical protein